MDTILAQKEKKRERRRKYYIKNKKRFDEYNKKYRAEHKNNYTYKEYRDTHREERALASRLYYAGHREEQKVKRENYRATHREELNAKAREKARAIRLEVLQRYGGKCMCCGEATNEFLVIDHINGGGSKHRKLIRNDIYSWLKKNNYPDGFQILCANCNMAKGHNKICPHQKVDKECLK